MFVRKLKRISLGGANLQCGYFSVEMYVKTKDLGPVAGRVFGVGWGGEGRRLDPPM